MTLAQMKTKTEFWLKLLGVDEQWSVTVSIGNTGNLEGLCGLNQMTPEQQLSHIMIAPDEGEETLVHEILHILLDGHKSGEDMKYEPLHELAINKISYALVDLATKKKNAKQSTARSITNKVKSTNKK